MKLQPESSNTQDNRDLTFDYISDTPFTIVNENNVYFGIMGKHRLTESFTDKDECKRELLAMTWNRLIQVVGIMISEQEALNEIFKDNKDNK